MKLQSTMPREVQEQHEATIKDDMEWITTAVNHCSQLFEDTMEVWASF